MSTTSTNPSGALWCGSSHGEAAVSSGHVHGGTAAHSARGDAYRSDETVVGDGSPSLVMVLGFKAMRKHSRGGQRGLVGARHVELALTAMVGAHGVVECSDAAVVVAAKLTMT